MAAQGVSRREIGLRLGKTIEGIRYCLNERYRRNQIARNGRKWAAYKAAGGKATCTMDLGRDRARRKCRAMFYEDGGGSPEDLRALYKKFECD